MTVLKYTLYGPIQSGCSLLHRYAENCVLTNLNEFFLRDLEVMRHHSGIIYKALATGLAAIDLLSGVRIASTLPARMFNVLKASFCKSIRAMAFRAYPKLRSGAFRPNIIKASFHALFPLAAIL